MTNAPMIDSLPTVYKLELTGKQCKRVQTIMLNLETAAGNMVRDPGSTLADQARYSQTLADAQAILSALKAAGYAS